MALTKNDVELYPVRSLEERVLAEINSGYWHTTSEDRFKGILDEGAILAEPNIPEKERWYVSNGAAGFPYTRHLGGVSLFNFEGFDSAAYTKRYPLSSWQKFVPICCKWDSAIWIEICQKDLPVAIISGRTLLDRWKEGEEGRMIMPIIEAAYIGEIPLIAFGRVFRVRKDRQDLEFLSLEKGKV